MRQCVTSPMDGVLAGYESSHYLPIISVSAWKTLVGDMRTDNALRDTVVAIGLVDEGGKFILCGTGFVVCNAIDDEVYQFIVSAKHVVRPIIDKFGAGAVGIRINTRDGDAAILKLPDWLDHPADRVDLSVCPAGISREAFAIKMLDTEGDLPLTQEKIDEADIGIGEEVAIVGMFIQRPGEKKNLPIVRGGIISAMPEEEIRTQYGRHEAYLIETRSFDGLSGSPVFVQLPPFKISFADGQAKFVRTEFSHHFMGMLLGHSEVRNETDILDIEVGDGSGETKEVIPLFNTGIGIVLPLSYIIEAIEQPKIHERRMAAEKAKRKTRRFVPDSAGGPSPSTTADNPSHKEDFNRLLSSVTTRKPRED